MTLDQELDSIRERLGRIETRLSLEGPQTDRERVAACWSAAENAREQAAKDAEIDGLRAEVRHFSEEARKGREEIARLKANNATLWKGGEEARAEAQRSLDAYRTVQQAADMARADTAQVSSQLSEARRKVDKALADHAKAAQERDDLKASLATAETEIAKYNQRWQDAFRERDGWKARYLREVEKREGALLMLHQPHGNGADRIYAASKILNAPGGTAQAAQPEPSRRRVWMVDGVSRRSRLDLMTPAERAITDAMAAVESAGADPLLTEAVTLLGQARDKVADHVDGADLTGKADVP